MINIVNCVYKNHWIETQCNFFSSLSVIISEGSILTNLSVERYYHKNLCIFQQNEAHQLIWMFRLKLPTMFIINAYKRAKTLYLFIICYFEKRLWFSRHIFCKHSKTVAFAFEYIWKNFILLKKSMWCDSKTLSFFRIG